jgi:deaminated glutathione amidase
MRMAVAQLSATMDKPVNLLRITDLTERAADAGARLVVFPEGAMCDFGTKTDNLHGVAEPLDGPFVQALSKLANRCGLTVVSGMFESIPGDQLIYNSAVVVAPSTGLAGVYRKRHLFDAFGEIESERFRAGGADPLLVDIEGFKVGVVICYDMRFASFIEKVADAGADLVLAPAAWVAGPLKEEHLAVVAHARALDNTMYVAVGGQGPPLYTGRSVIVDPLGATLASLGDADGVATAELSHDRLKAARTRLPVLRQRRAAAHDAAVTTRRS